MYLDVRTVSDSFSIPENTDSAVVGGIELHKSSLASATNILHIASNPAIK